MQDYNEVVTIRGKEQPRLKIQRLRQGYGFMLVDMKFQPKHVLFISKNRKEVNQLKADLLENPQTEIPEYEMPVYDGRLIRFDETHGPVYYSVPTYADYCKVCLHVIKERHSQGWYFEPENPIKDADLEFMEKYETYTDDPEKWIEVYDENYVKHYTEKEKEYKALLRAKKAYKYNLSDYNTLLKAIETDNDILAASFMETRNGLQYEEFEIIDSIKL